MRVALKIGRTLLLVIVALVATIIVVAVYVVDDHYYLKIVHEAMKDSTSHEFDISGQFEVDRVVLHRKRSRVTYTCKSTKLKA